MTTISEAIAALRAKREANNEVREKLRLENVVLSAQIRELETAIRPPKKARASPNDPVTTVLKVEAAQVVMRPQLGE